MYHFYLGDPVELLLLFLGRNQPAGYSGHMIWLAGQQVQFVVPAGAWQGSRLMPGGSFALLGTTMAPGLTRPISPWARAPPCWPAGLPSCRYQPR